MNTIENGGKKELHPGRGPQLSDYLATDTDDLRGEAARQLAEAYGDRFQFASNTAVAALAHGLAITLSYALMPSEQLNDHPHLKAISFHVDAYLRQVNTSQPDEGEQPDDYAELLSLTDLLDKSFDELDCAALLQFASVLLNSRFAALFN